MNPIFNIVVKSGYSINNTIMHGQDLRALKYHAIPGNYNLSVRIQKLFLLFAK
jgi:hypothetical protein